MFPYNCAKVFSHFNSLENSEVSLSVGQRAYQTNIFVLQVVKVQSKNLGNQSSQDQVCYSQL